jgi:hypothetical protein
MSKRELIFFKKQSHKPHQNTTRKNSKRDLEDLLEVLPSSRSEALQMLRSKNLKIEFRMHSAPLELPVMKVLFQVVE